MEDRPTPAVPLPLLEFLEHIFPDRCPTEQMTERESCFAAGAAKVVRKLRSMYKEQTHT